MILVDEKECLLLVKQHRFRELKEMFSVEGMHCNNCKHIKESESGNKYCDAYIGFQNEDEFCSLWEKKI